MSHWLVARISTLCPQPCGNRTSGAPQRSHCPPVDWVPTGVLCTLFGSWLRFLKFAKFSTYISRIVLLSPKFSRFARRIGVTDHADMALRLRIGLARRKDSNRPMKYIHCARFPILRQSKTVTSLPHRCNLPGGAAGQGGRLVDVAQSTCRRTAKRADR